MNNIEDLTDEELAYLVASKKPDLYREIVTRYQNKLQRYAFSIVHDDDEAVDIVQESFIKAYINLRGFNREKKFSSWIYRIIHNEALNSIKKRRKQVNLDEEEWDEIADEKHLEEMIESEEVKEKVTDCLSKLPLSYREPIALFYIESRSYDEISEILRLPIGTVGTNINRGKKELRSICKRTGGNHLI